MKFCKDCTHCVPAPNGIARLATCAKATEPARDYLVTGEGPSQQLVFCTVARIGPTREDNCGFDAGWFIPIAVAA